MLNLKKIKRHKITKESLKTNNVKKSCYPTTQHNISSVFGIYIKDLCGHDFPLDKTLIFFSGNNLDKTYH